jgi:hypothetical protein
MAKSKKSDSEKSKKSDKEKKGKKKKDKVTKEVVVNADPKPAPAKPKAKAAKPEKTKPAAKPAPVITNDDISLRAYFIAERRQAMGWPGDSSSDWAEAERQLKAEAARKAKK